MQQLSPVGRRVRVAATVLGAGLLLLGTLVGQDDDFPFGPFRMFATTDKLNAPVRDTRVVAEIGGKEIGLDERNTGFRRAEVEGQLDRFKADPALLRFLAQAYDDRHPGAARVEAISIVVKWHTLKDGRPTGETREETVVTWAG